MFRERLRRGVWPGSLFPALLLAPLLASGQGTYRETLEHMYSQPGEFMLHGQLDNEIISYESPRDVRICVKQHRHAVGLHVSYDEKNALVRPGNCFEFEARQVSISPAKPLEESWTLHGTVETRGRG